MYQKRNKLDILVMYLGDYRKQFYLRELSRISNNPLKTTQNFLSRLEKEKIVKSMISGKNKYFKLNLDNIHTKLSLLNAELHKTSGFIEKYPSFKTFLKDIKTNDLIIVFGSFAKLNARLDSDLDIVVVGGKNANLPFHLLPNKVHKLEISRNNFVELMEKQEALIKEIEESHIILNNHSLYIGLMWDYYGRK